jgi:hypothetical protein
MRIGDGRYAGADTFRPSMCLNEANVMGKGATRHEGSAFESLRGHSGLRRKHSHDSQRLNGVYDESVGRKTSGTRWRPRLRSMKNSSGRWECDT